MSSKTDYVLLSNVICSCSALISGLYAFGYAPVLLRTATVRKFTLDKKSMIARSTTGTIIFVELAAFYDNNER